MPQDFVRYSPDIERADPDFDENLQTVIEATKKYIEGSVKSEGLNTAVRDAHAKGYGLARAEVEILGGLAPEYAQDFHLRSCQPIAFGMCIAHSRVQALTFD